MIVLGTNELNWTGEARDSQEEEAVFNKKIFKINLLYAQFKR